MNFETSDQQLSEQATTVRAVPPDLLGVLVYTVLVNVVVWIPGLADATVAGASIRTLLGIPAVLFLPGYLLVSIAFPGIPDRRTGGGRFRRRGIDTAERLALSFGLSVAVLPLYGLALDTVWSLTPTAILTSLTVLLLIGVGVATLRQHQLPPEERFGAVVELWLELARQTLSRRQQAGFGAATVILAAAILLAAGSVGFAVATPFQSGQSSTFYLVSENETGADLAANYPTTFTVGESQPVTATVENDENHPQAYTVVVTLERVGADGTAITESRELTRLHGAAEAGGTWSNQHAIEPGLSGEDLRLHYYLYTGDTAPSTPESSTAYHDLFLWIDVTEA